MAYQEFAYFYDEFNGAADYDALFAYVTGELKAHGIQDGIVADFGCGTGELTLMLAQAGYDMIGIDVSEEMLSVLRDKADALGLPLTNPMLLCQDLLQLDLYGTIRAAVSTFDTYNHIGPLENFEKAIAKAAFFMEKDGVFVFDLNTPYKHEKVLSGQTFDFDEDDAACRWSNRYDPQTGRVDLSIDIHYKDTGEDFHESFSEYSYPLDTVKALLTRYGFDPVKIADGESFVISGLISSIVPQVRRVRPALRAHGLGSVWVVAGGAALKQCAAADLDVDYVAENAFDGARYIEARFTGATP